MPFKSQAQRKFMFANHPAMAHRWAEHTKDLKHLPEHVQHKQANLNEAIELAHKLPSLRAVDREVSEGQTPIVCLQDGLARTKMALAGLTDGPFSRFLALASQADACQMRPKAAQADHIPVSLLSMVDLETKSSANEYEDLEGVSPYLARVNAEFGARNNGRFGPVRSFFADAASKRAAAPVPVTTLQAKLVIPHMGHLRTPTAAALHALQARQAEEAAELAKKTKTDAPPPGFHQTDGAQQAIGFQSGATGGQPGTGTSVGPGNSPSSHPITSYSGLGAPGTVNGNAAFGTRNNALGGAAKSGAAIPSDGEGGYWAKDGERCQHCGALHERGDDGTCNSCGRVHDHPDYLAKTANDRSLWESYNGNAAFGTRNNALGGAAKSGAAIPNEGESALARLLRAKEHSDRKQYPAKHGILQALLAETPDAFRVDSELGRFAGLTHIPTNFRIHMPANQVPGSLFKQAGKFNLFGTLVPKTAPATRSFLAQTWRNARAGIQPSSDLAVIEDALRGRARSTGAQSQHFTPIVSELSQLPGGQAVANRMWLSTTRGRLAMQEALRTPSPAYYPGKPAGGATPAAVLSPVRDAVIDVTNASNKLKPVVLGGAAAAAGTGAYLLNQRGAPRNLPPSAAVATQTVPATSDAAAATPTAASPPVVSPPASSGVSRMSQFWADMPTAAKWGLGGAAAAAGGYGLYRWLRPEKPKTEKMANDRSLWESYNGPLTDDQMDGLTMGHGCVLGSCGHRIEGCRCHGGKLIREKRAELCHECQKTKQAGVEPMPRWKKEPQVPLSPDFLSQPQVQNLLEALGMDVSGTGALTAKKIARCEGGAIIADGEQDKEAGFGNALRAVGTNSLRAAKTLAGVPAGQSFAAKPVRNTMSALGMRGVKPMRQLGNVALGSGALAVGGQAYDTVNNLVHAPQRMAETIGKPLGLPQTEIDGMAGDIGEHSVGALKELFTPGFLRSSDTPAAQTQRELGRKLLWNQARSSFYEATHDVGQESTWDKARRLMGYRTPLSATVTEAVDRGPAYVSELVGKGQAMRPELMRYMQAVDPTTPLGQRAVDLSKRMYGRISTGIGKAGADKEAASIPKMLAGRRTFAMVRPSKIGNPATPSGLNMRVVGGHPFVYDMDVDHALKELADSGNRGLYFPGMNMGVVKPTPGAAANTVRRHEVMHGLIRNANRDSLGLVGRAAAKLQNTKSFMGRTLAPVVDEAAAHLGSGRTTLQSAGQLAQFMINPDYWPSLRAAGTWLSPVVHAVPAAVGTAAAGVGLGKVLPHVLPDSVRETFRHALGKEAGLHELVTHPAAPFIVQPAIGAVGGLAMNEVMRHLLDTYYGRELPQKTIDRERVQAAGMGAGMGLVRAALPRASESIMKMIDPGPSGTV